ncbi:MAG: WG repeat-containing protein [Bacteroidales bacterium]|nr:WG repeat-containing protein [Bacteroidales bacterium]
MRDKQHNPYIGLRTYEEADSAFFRGRRKGVADLFHLIAENDVVVLHAESGEGKSSLLNAGLVPMLRDKRYFPIHISFIEDDFSKDNPDFNEIVYERIKNAVDIANDMSANGDMFESGASADGKISFRPLKIAGCDVDSFRSLRGNIWWLLRHYVLTVYGVELIPVLIFDQFEEVFSKPKDISWTEDFFCWLSSVLSDEVPQEVVAQVREAIGEEKVFPNLSTQKHYKALFSLRTEYMGELDYWAIQRHHVMVMKNSRYCLKPLTEDEADEVLSLQPAFTPMICNEIKSAISTYRRADHRKRLPVIPAMLLSVVSTTASENIRRGDEAFVQMSGMSDEAASRDVFNSVITQFYSKEIAEASIPDKDLAAIENILVDDKGKRVRIKAECKALRKMKFEQKYKDLLEEKRLIKSSLINGDEYVELTHDALARVIIGRREKRSISNINLKTTIIQAVLIMMAALLGLAWSKIIIGWGSEYAFMLDFKERGFGRQLLNFAIFSGLLYATSSMTRRLGTSMRLVVWGMVYLVMYSIFLAKRGMLDPLYLDYKLLLSVAVTCPFFAVGAYLTGRGWKWKCIGYAICALLLFPVILSCTSIVALSLEMFAVFALGGYALKREGNMPVVSLVAISFIIISHFLYHYSSGFVFVSLAVIIGLFIILGIWGFSWEKKLSGSKCFDEIFSFRQFSTNKFINTLFNIFAVCIVVFISISIGMTLDGKLSLLSSLPIALALIYFYWRFGRKGVGAYRMGITVTVILSVFLICISQFFVFHTVFTIVVWILSASVILFIACRNRKLKNSSEFFCMKPLSLASMWLLAVVGLPFVLMGHNLLIGDGTYRVWNGTLRANPYVKLMYVKDGDGLVGVSDRWGKMVIPAKYISIYKTPDNLREAEFIMYDGDILSSWNPIYHITERNAFTDNIIARVNEYMNISEPLLQGMSVRGYPEEKINLHAEKALIEMLTDVYNYEVAGSADKRINEFDFGDERLLTSLAAVPYDKLDLSLLAYTSEGFQAMVMRQIVPNMQIYPFGKVSDVLQKDFERSQYRLTCTICNGSGEQILKDKMIAEKCSACEGRGTKEADVTPEEIKKHYNVSQDADVDVLKSYVIGDLYRWLGGIYLELKDYRTSGEYTSKAMAESFSEPASVDNLIADYLTAPDRNAQKSIEKRLQNSQMELIRINSGFMDYPDPNLEGAWKFLRYNHLIDILGARIQSLQGKISSQDISKLEGLVEAIIPHSSYSLAEFRRQIPYSDIQKIPQPDGEPLYRYKGTIPSFQISRLGNVGISPSARSYSFYVKDGEPVTPVLTFFSVSKTDESAPVLAVDYLSKKKYFFEGVWPTSLLDAGQPRKIAGGFDHAWCFQDGLAAVEVNGRIGFIDYDGKWVIEPRFKSPFSVSSELQHRFMGLYSSKKYKEPLFNDGVCPVYDDNLQLRYIDRTGDYVKTDFEK